MVASVVPEVVTCPKRTRPLMGFPWPFAPGTMKMDPPMKVFTTKSPPPFQSPNEGNAGSNAEFKPSASPGDCDVVVVDAIDVDTIEEKKYYY